MRTYNKLVINTSAGFNKCFAKTCFIVLVILIWNCLLNLQSSKKQVTLISKYSLQNIELVEAPIFYEEPNRSTSKITHFLDFDNDQFITDVSGLIILSSMRSGSSFLGQFFNQNPSIFYFFEPLFPLQYA